jgi:hypothetical protein
MKFTESINAKLSKYVMCKSTQPMKMRRMFPVLSCLMLCELIGSHEEELTNAELSSV